MSSRYSYPQIICNITDIGFQHITCDIGLSVGRYFGINNKLSVLPIFDCNNMLSRHFHLPNHLLYRLILWILGIGICQYWRVFHQNFDLSTTCNTYFLAGTCKLKIQDINITIILQIGPAPTYMHAKRVYFLYYKHYHWLLASLEISGAIQY